MTARRGIAIASTAVATIVAVALATSGRAETAAPAKQTAMPMAMPITSRAAARERPRGVVEDCSRISGVGARRDFWIRSSLVVGPLALLHAAPPWAYRVEGEKLFVVVRGGHRVTLELSPRTRRGAGLVFGRFPNANVRLRDSRRVVTFIACQRGEKPPGSIPDGWPVSGWVGGLLARSPQCVPLLVWVNDEPSPRRAVIRFGVRDCGVRAPEQPTLCTAGEVEALVGRFVGAFNNGNAGELDDIFAREPEFEWYSTDAPGERLTPLANDRPSLVGYLRDRHALSEQLKLGSFTFNGNTTGSRPYGNFVYTLTRSADDLAATPYRGKGAAFCYRNRSDIIFVWSMARE